MEMENPKSFTNYKLPNNASLLRGQTGAILDELTSALPLEPKNRNPIFKPPNSCIIDV